MVGEACLPSNAYYPRTPDYTLYSGVHVCWSEHFDLSFVDGFMSLDYGLGTMTATTSTIPSGYVRGQQSPRSSCTNTQAERGFVTCAINDLFVLAVQMYLAIPSSVFINRRQILLSKKILFISV